MLSPPTLSRSPNDCNFTFGVYCQENALRRRSIAGGSTFETILPSNLSWMVFMIFNILQLINLPTIVILFFLFCLKWGDWKNWRKYYPTILYVIVWDLIFYIITVNHPLWRFEHPVLKHTFSDLLIAFIAFPSAILLYLPYIPKKSIVKQIFHIALWVFIFSLCETTDIALHTISYHNGWSFWWSVASNIAIFCTIRIHYEKPLLVWPLSVLLFIITIIIFGIPLSSLI